MARLTKARRAAIPTSQFAGPHRSFPIPDVSHGRAALSMAHNAANPAAIKAAVHRKFPQIDQRPVGKVLSKHPHRNLGHYLHPSKKS